MAKTYPAILTFLLYTVLTVSFCAAQEQINFRQLSIKEGLSQNSGISVAQDSTGYLWIATQDGLNRYDGTKFSVFPFIFTDITRPDYSHLGKVFVDRQGAIWCIPSSRILQKFNTKTSSFQPIPITQDASVIFQDENFNFWIGTYSKGLIFWDAKKDSIQTKLFVEETGTVFDLAQNGQKLLAATEKAIVEINLANGKKEISLNQTFFGELVGNQFSSIAIDKNGRQWFGTFGAGLYFRDKGRDFLNQSLELPLSIPLPLDLNILSLLVDSSNRLWIGTYGNGLYMLNLTDYTTHHFVPDKYNPKAIHYNDILSIYEDYTGTIWFGTDGGGLSYYDEYLEKFNSITNYQVPETINVDVVRAITKDSDGSILIGTSGKGLMHYYPNTNSWEEYTAESLEKTKLPSNRIMSLFVDRDGDLWIGTQGGGLSIRKKNGVFKNYFANPVNSLSAITIWDIFKDTKNRVWLATREKGLIQFDKEKGVLANFNGKNATKQLSVENNIRVITEGFNGSLWLGTDSKGLIHLDLKQKITEEYRFRSEANSISSNKIKSLYYSKKDNLLWVGTYGEGLDVYDIQKDTFYSYSEKDGLSNNVIYGILPDKEGNLWLSSNKGITKFRLEASFDTPPEITNYANYEGLASEFNTGAYFSDQEGNLYFGGLEGIYWFSPESIKKNTNLPKTVITGMQVANEPYPMKEKMRLGHQQHTLSFNFASLQFSLPEKNQYQYRLLNYDANWIHAGNSNFARYSYLPHGAYVFQVKSSNYDGVWNEDPAVFPFRIAPPWYWSPGSKIAYFILLLIAIFGVYQYLKWRWKMRLNLQLKEAEAQRLQRLNDFKSKLYTDISHEFRTPLTLIAAPIDAKLKEGQLLEADFAKFTVVKRNTKRLIALVDQLLDLAKLEKGKLKIKLKNGNLGLFLGNLARAFDYRAQEKEIAYRISIKGLETAWYDADVMEKIISNLLSNAIKYCPRGGSCSFAAKEYDGNVIFNIQNTLDAKAHPEPQKLFERFYQGDEKAAGAGVGLALVKELTRVYKGEIQAEIKEENLILFCVSLPVTLQSLKNARLLKDDFNTSYEIPKNPIFSNSLTNTGSANAKKLPVVLLVEDHKEVREYLKSVWEEKFTLLEAQNGAEGIKIAMENVPDLVLTDIRMPVCDGVELCNTLKTDQRTSHIPIILLTSGTGTEKEIKGLKSGADDYISKPFSLPILEKRMDNLIALRNSLKSKYSQEYIFQAKGIAITPTDELFFNRVQTILDEHLSNPNFNATMFHQELGMSRMQLHRKLQTYTGLSTTGFIRSQRLKQAVKILSTSDANINEVAYAVGFNTSSYFIKCFKETYKKTPLEYALNTRNT